jgi:hypothetical protein
MALDLNKVVPQAVRMATRLKEERLNRAARLTLAGEVLAREASRVTELNNRASHSKTAWPVAGLIERFDRSYPPPLLPASFTVLGTDGSHIDIDRHRSVRCYVINIGAVRLEYGAYPDASLENRPRVYFEPTDMAYLAPDNSRELAIEGNLLSVKRAVEECRTLADMAAQHGEGLPTLALLDGSLMLWGLLKEDYPEFIWKILLDEGYLGALDALYQQAHRPLALASYISYPRSTEVVNVLRLALCPYEPADCKRYCRSKPPGERECDAVVGLLDRELFRPILKPGERSTVFASSSSIVRERYGPHRTYFYYLRLEDEVARIEIPAWGAESPERLGLSHALVFDQCRRGQGYPVVLSEAHEQAVVSGLDRDNFWRLVESSLTEAHLNTDGSAKNQSKRTRWI